MEGSNREMDGSDQVLATEELKVRIGYKKTKSGSDTKRSATKRVVPEVRQEQPKAVETFQKTSEDKEGVEEIEFETAPGLHVSIVLRSKP